MENQEIESRDWNGPALVNGLGLIALITEILGYVNYGLEFFMFTMLVLLFLIVRTLKREFAGSKITLLVFSLLSLGGIALLDFALIFILKLFV